MNSFANLSRITEMSFFVVVILLQSFIYGGFTQVQKHKW